MLEGPAGSSRGGQASPCQQQGAFLPGVLQLLLDRTCLNLPCAVCQGALAVVGHPLPPHQPVSAKHPDSGWGGESRREAELEVQNPHGLTPLVSPVPCAAVLLPKRLILAEEGPVWSGVLLGGWVGGGCWESCSPDPSHGAAIPSARCVGDVPSLLCSHRQGEKGSSARVRKAVSSPGADGTPSAQHGCLRGL